MENGSLIPITDEQAKLGQEIIKALSGVGTFFKDALGSVPADLIGYLGGDWLRLRRAENIAQMMRLTQVRLEQWDVKEPVSAPLTLALPIIRGAADESREELQCLWARLLAATLDPSRASKVRQGFAEVVLKLDPLDAVVINFLQNRDLKTRGYDGGRQMEEYGSELGVSKDEFEISVLNLRNLALIEDYSSATQGLTAFCREFLRVVSD